MEREITIEEREATLPEEEDSMIEREEDQVEEETTGEETSQEMETGEDPTTPTGEKMRGREAKGETLPSDPDPEETGPKPILKKGSPATDHMREGATAGPGNQVGKTEDEKKEDITHKSPKADPDPEIRRPDIGPAVEAGIQIIQEIDPPLLDPEAGKILEEGNPLLEEDPDPNPREPPGETNLEVDLAKGNQKPIE